MVISVNISENNSLKIHREYFTDSIASLCKKCCRKSKQIINYVM